MARNKYPVLEVTDNDVGRLISYQCAGMERPDWGTVSGPSRIDNMCFIKFQAESGSKLTSIYNCRWGWTEPWLQLAEGGGWEAKPEYED